MRWTQAVLVGVLTASSAAFADWPEKEPYLGLHLGGTMALDRWDLGTHAGLFPGNALQGTLRGGFQWSKQWAGEVGVSFLPVTVSSGSDLVLSYDASVLYHLTDGDWSLFALGGVGLYHATGGALGADVDPSLHLGLGVRGLVLPWLVVRGQLRDVVTDGVGGPENNVEATLGVDVFVTKIGKPADRDEDGVADLEDACPDTVGVASLKGCPDADKDGIADADDACRLVPGVASAKGCPDQDGDGLTDADDACPASKGTAANKGCPDTDGDGVIDTKDACPSTPGLAKLEGCPDKDGDGIADAKDACPAVAGTAEFEGCPDTDGDKIPDRDDKCPAVAGTPAAHGCPDKDGDLVVDAEDQCPDLAGLPEYKGCLPPEMKKFSGAIKGIQFATGKAEILKASFGVLDEAVTVLKKFTGIRLRVEGHTDNVGDAQKNLELSQARADAVRAYLVGKGIDGGRFEAKGYGDTRPVADNATAAGKAQNRRVEFTMLGQ